MTGRIPARAAKLAAALLTATAVLAVSAGSASAAAEVIYNNIPGPPTPGNLPSVGFEATSTSQFGGEVEFAGTAREYPTVVVLMSTWACQSGSWNAGTCKTAPGASFEWPITFSVYEAGPGNSVGAKIAGGTRVFRMPYRPSASPKCTGANAGKWFHVGTCFNGKAFKIRWVLKDRFKLTGGKLPEKAIIAVSYNTSDYGAEPQGLKPCNESSAGCPYDSLNVAVTEPSETEPSVGKYPNEEEVYVYSTSSEMYCGNSLATGSFGPSGKCWKDEQPTIEVVGYT